ncbi:Arc family DNA-binding protein [Rhizobium leguminosarum bv. viciae]|uniref:Arc family DNA-binding protein n=1 Tax=Rhizobium leguminosarum TaxID=384 RepID=UPI0014410D09|nr:Arc family DNA-binding protein [Rhizobium leguminosarum]NKK87564.1 Arc family DNA-binding protein [Rhizobium leguminosarum bv. viciae]
MAHSLMAERTPQEQDKYVVRFPDGMRDRLKDEAAKNSRSLNAEIIARLEDSFENSNRAPSSIDEIAKSAARQLTNAPHIPIKDREAIWSLYETIKLEETRNIRKFMTRLSEVIADAEERSAKK